VAEETLSLDIDASDLVAIIAGGDTTVSTLNPLTLDGSASYDPDDDESDFSYSWTCENVADTTECVD